MKISKLIILCIAITIVGCAKPKAEKQNIASTSEKQSQNDQSGGFVENFELNEGLQDFADRYSNMSSDEMVGMIEDQASSLLGSIDEFIPKFWKCGTITTVVFSH